MADDRHGDFESIEKEAYEWVRRFASGKASEADLKALELWSAKNPEHRKVFQRVSLTWEGLGPVTAELSQEGAFFRRKDVLARLATPASSRLRRRALIGGGLAASAAVVAAVAVQPPLGLWPSWAELTADYRTATGEQRRVVLPSGVSIAMNTRTSIALQPNVGQASRIELISGEAMIATQTADAAPFIVDAGGGRVVATNACFNMWCDSRAVCVTCLGGAVTVERGANTLPLSPGQQVIYADGEIGQVATINPDIVTSWLNGMVVFRYTPVAQVIEEVNRYRPGKIILTNATLGRQQINARLRIQDIGRVVSQIQEVFGAHVTNLPGGIILLG